MLSNEVEFKQCPKLTMLFCISLFPINSLSRFYYSVFIYWES